MKAIDELIAQCEQMCCKLDILSFSDVVTIDEGRALEAQKWQVYKLRNQLQEMRG
jgi:hypothetical protein